jgi:PAS domain S-box-containing protein
MSDLSPIYENRHPGMRVPFHTKLLVPVLAFLILIPVFTVWILDRHIDKSAQEEAQKTLTTVRAVFRNSLEIRERNLEIRFKNMVNEPRFKAVVQLNDPNTMYAFLKGALSEFGEEVQIVLFTPEDSNVRQSGVDRRALNAPVPIDNLETPITYMALNGTIGSGIARYDESAYNIISVPVTISENSDPMGALTIWIELGYNAVNDLKSLTRTEVILFEDDKILASTLNISGNTQKEIQNLIKIGSNSSGVVAQLIEGKHFHILVGKIGNHEDTKSSLNYILLSSYEENLKALSLTRTKLLLVSALGIIISIGIIPILVRNITKPLRELHDSAEAVGKGNLNRKVEINSNDEFGDLANAFNQMTFNIKSSRSQLEANVVELEKTQKQLLLREARLRESEEGLRLIIEGARDHVIFTINEEGNILRWNGAAERLLGYSNEEVQTANYGQFFDDEDQENRLDKQLIETARSEGRSEFEGWRVGKDGKRFWADVTLSRLDHLPGETTGGYVEIARDISTRKKAEETLVEARNAAEASNTAKNEFMGNMSHEIRTPMNGVIGMTSLLLEEELNKEQRDLAETIKTSADSLLEIIDDILDISKIESGQLEIIPAPVNLIDLVEITVDSFAHLCAKKDLTLDIFIAKEIPTLFESDGLRIRQVISNLLGNAVKFTEKGGIRLNMTYSEKTHEICISVVDSGIGIPADKLDQLFKPFFQVESSNSRRFGGTGLGLSISRKIAHLLEGEIRVQSVFGQGSTFTFTMKVEPMQEEKILKAFPQTRATFVSNNVQCKSCISDQLIDWSCEVTHFDLTPESLKKALENKSCDLLIIDDAENHKAVQSIMEAQQNPNIPWVRLLSNNQKPNKPWPGKGLYLNKPIKPFELNGCFSKLLKNENPVKTETIAQASQKNELDSSFAESHPLDILIVEDNSINAKVLETILKKLGYKTDVAVNGQDCLRAMEEKKYDFIFMDLQMPIMDGYKATVRILNSSNITHPVFITAFTANARQDDRDACEAVGMHDFVAKPARPNKIVEALQRGHTWLQQKVPVQDS